MKAIITTVCLLLCFGEVRADTFAVNTTADVDVCNATTCTLRGAINAALATPGADTIEFDIPADPINENYFTGGSGQSAYQYWLIQPTTELPYLIDITMDGSTAGSSVAGNPTIVLDGALAGNVNPGPNSTIDGLTLLGDATVNGLSLTNWFNAGVRLGYEDGSQPSHNNRITNSWLGLNMPYGQASAPNKFGIVVRTAAGLNNVIGGFMETEGNVISGNLVFGVFFDYYLKNGSVGVLGNKIGTNPQGDLAVPNDNSGMFLSTMENANILIGFDTPGLGNLISGNGSFGIHVSVQDVDVNLNISNNFIGTDISGQTSLPNREGIQLSFGRDIHINNNLISGNSGSGIFLSGANEEPLRDVFILSNLIGVAEDGVSPLPNLRGGIYNDGTTIGTIIGAEGAGNVVAHNLCGPLFGCGVVVSNSSNSLVTIRHNSIHSNENEGLDLGADRFTPNDPGDFDAGANRLQNFPEINTAQHDPNGNRINMNFWVDSSNAASDYPIMIDVYAADADGEEGRTWLASTTFTESQWLTGNPVTRTLSAQAPIAENDVIVTTATGAGGRTSEFSPGFTLAGQADFSISCANNRFTTSPSLSCQIDCQAEAVNGWGDEVGLSCTHLDSACVFSPSDEISFTQEVMPFTVNITHDAPTPGLYLNEVLGSVDTPGDPIERSEVITIQQLTDDDYLFIDSFDGIICD